MALTRWLMTDGLGFVSSLFETESVCVCVSVGSWTPGPDGWLCLCQRSRFVLQTVADVHRPQGPPGSG